MLIRKDTETEYKAKVDQTKKRFMKTNPNFDRLYNGKVRRLKVSVTEFVRTDSLEGSKVSGRYRLVLRSVEPDWKLIDPTYVVYRDVDRSIQTSISNQ